MQTQPFKSNPIRLISRKERKLALLQDVDKLKKKLRQEENVHRALERAFSRRLGTLPHLPPYLPPQTLELLAEVAVLEEEVVRLEEEVVSFRQGLYKEAVYLSSKININSDNNNDNNNSSLDQSSSIEIHSQQKPLNSLTRSASTRLSYSNRIGPDFLNRLVDKKPADLKKPDLINSVDGVLGKENRSAVDSNSKIKSSPESVADEVRSLVKRPQNKFETAGKHIPPKPQNKLVDQEKIQESCSSSSSGERNMEAESECNKISENVLKCLIGIFLRLSKLKAKTIDAEAFSNLMSLDLTGGDRGPPFRDPYGVCLKSKRRDIGPYKDLFAIETGLIDFKKKTSASLLIRRLKLLLEKLASVSIDGLTHQQKLAFWINTYNICMMNAYLEHGIPDSHEMMPALMQKATLKVGGYLLNAFTIEHFILRLPNRLKLSCQQSVEHSETEIRGKFGLEWSEPLVTFALCSGSWSSPAVRVYTSAQVENELAIAKRDYLQAACGITTKTNRLLIPNMLDWYLLDFGKDFEALIDWVCLQLPGELRKQAVAYLEKRGREPINKKVQVMPYDYRFRYLIQR